MIKMENDWHDFKQYSLNKFELHKRKPIIQAVTMVQNVSLRTAGRSHTGPLPLGNKTTSGQLTGLIQTLASRQQVNLVTADRTHAGPLPFDKSAMANPVVIIQTGHHGSKCQP